MSAKVSGNLLPAASLIRQYVIMRFIYRYLIFVILFLAASALENLALGQQPDMPAERDQAYGEIPDSLFYMERYAPAPSASYLYTLKELHITFENDGNSVVALMDYHVRIKVFDASAREVSLVAIPYYFDRKLEQVVEIEAATHLAPGRQISLKEGAVRTININSRYNVKEFTLPEVRDGAVLEYKYRVKRRYIEELPDFYLNNQAPTALARVSLTYPGYLRYQTIVENYDGALEHTTEEIDTSSVAKVFTLPRPDPILKETWTARDIPAMEDEAYISSVDDYRGKLKFKMSEFGVPRQSLENSWDFVVAELRRNQNVLEIARNNEKARALGRSIARRMDDDEMEAVQDSIFRYLNGRVNFSGNKSPYSEMGDVQVLSGEPADQAAINQTLLAMLQGAGIEAYPLLISTRQFGQINRSFPSFFQFNGQLIYSEIDGSSYYMDASFPHSQPNLIPVDTYNETGLLLKRNSYSWQEIKPVKSLFDISISMEGRLDEEGNLTGTVRARSAGYPVQVIRQKRYNGDNVSAIVRQAVFDGYSKASLQDPKLENLHSYQEPVTVESRFRLPRYGTSFSDGIEFRPMVVGFLLSNPFQDERRDYPVTLDAPEKLNLSYEIEIPDGFEVQAGYQNKAIELPGARFAESYNFSDGLLRYEFNIDISRKSFEPDLYPQLLKLYERWVELSNTQWLIKRQ